MRPTLLCVLLFAGLFIYLEVRTVARSVAAHNDTHCYLEAARAITAGGDPYDGTGYLYPPFLAIALVPIAILGELPAAVIWSTLVTAAAALSIALLARIVPLARGGAGASALVLALLVFRPLESNAGNGQANTLVLLAFVLTGLALGRRRDGAAGWAVALGGLIKVVPFGLGAYALLRGRRRALAHLAAGVLAGGILLPLIALGPARAIDTTRAFLGIAAGSAAAPVATGEPGGGYTPGHSLRSAVVRLLSPVDTRSGDDRVTTVHIAALSPTAVSWAYRAALLLVGLLGVAVWLRPEADEERRLRRDLAVAGLVALLASPVARKAAYVLLAVPYAHMLGELRGVPWRRWVAPIGAGIGALAALLLAVVLGGTAPPWAPLAAVAGTLIATALLRGRSRLAFALAFSAATASGTSSGLLGRETARETLSLAVFTYAALVPLVAMVLDRRTAR